MPLPVIDFAFRCTLNFDTAFGISPRNVFHVISLTAGEEEIGAAIHDNWEDNMLGPVSDQLQVESVTILKLDGAAAGFDQPMGGGFQGQASGEMMPSSALVLSLKTGHRGPSGRGRMYLGPVTESDCAVGLYDGSVTRTDIIAAWTTFNTNLFSSSAACRLAVASYKDELARGLASISISQVLGTQRRRQDQLR